jgi:hypothetical protein
MLSVILSEKFWKAVNVFIVKERKRIRSWPNLIPPQHYLVGTKKPTDILVRKPIFSSISEMQTSQIRKRNADHSNVPFGPNKCLNLSQ